MIHEDRLLSGHTFRDLLGDADSALVFPRAPEGRMGSDAEQAITMVLHAVETGDAQAAERLLPLVYEHLRSVARSLMAKESPGHTLQPTALVHEAFLRVVGRDATREWEHRGHFFGAAAQAMRRILVDQARRKAAIKRGGDRQRVDVDLLSLQTPTPGTDLVALDEVLQRLELVSPRKAQIVNLRYFAGLTIDETAATLGVSAGTIEREWRYIKSWIFVELTDHDDPASAPRGRNDYDAND